MKNYRWNEKKNILLKETRKISFESVVIHIAKGDLVDIIENPSSNYPDQKILVININDFVYAVPFAENENELFLKTIIPSRKLTKLYLGDER